jgi:hypothetical protein
MIVRINVILFDWGIIYYGGLFEIQRSRFALIQQDEATFFQAKYSLIVTSLDNASIRKECAEWKVEK